MRIVIDLQGAQAPGSRTRGIGRYSLALAQHIALRGRDRHHIQIALNGGFTESVEEIVHAFKGVVERQDIKIWQPGTDRGFASASPASTLAAAKLYETFLHGLQPDVVHISSLFEGLGDPTITSIGAFAPLRTSVTLYDLIPLINPDPYLNDPTIRRWYMAKIEALRKADLWLAISESSRQEGLDHLHLDPTRCVNVSTAAGNHFQPSRPSEASERELRSKYGLDRKFIMYTGGIDHRKNLEGLIRAFAHLPEALRQSHQVAIVCSARDNDRDRLLQLARAEGIPPTSVVITGFVPENDLVDLYNLCDLFVFPSWHEGFGLPALEAMMCGAPVIASNCSSLPEVVGREEVLFDPRDDGAIGRKMAQVLADESMRRRIAQEGLAQSRKFSWDESARRAIEAFELLMDRSNRPLAVPTPAIQHAKPALAYVSPLPPERTGIASYSAELLPELSRLFDITLITSTVPTGHGAGLELPRKDVEWLRANACQFDHVLYHFGNSEFHQHMFELLEDVPGTVVLHDFFLSGIQAHREFAGLQPANWSRALYESHGYPALRHRFTETDASRTIYAFPCNFDVLRAARGVIVHSPYSQALAREWYETDTADEWALIPHMRALPTLSVERRQAARQRLGFGPDDFVVCTFGIIGPTKLNDRLLHAWSASSLARRSDCALVYVGKNDEGDFGKTLLAGIASSPNPSSIRITGWADDDLFQQYLDAADAAVQLRTLSRGETSGTVLDALSRGLPTIVNANGSMQYLPDDTVLKIPDQFSDEQLIDALERLRSDPATIASLRTKARALIEKEHSPQACARMYADALQAFVATDRYRRPGLLQHFAREGLSASEAELRTLAAATVRSLPLPRPARRIFVDLAASADNVAPSNRAHRARAMLSRALCSLRAGYRVEPVRLSDEDTQFFYARRFALELLNAPHCLPDEPIDFRQGDIYVGVDMHADALRLRMKQLYALKHQNVRLNLLFVDEAPLRSAPVPAPGVSDDSAVVVEALNIFDGVLYAAKGGAQQFDEWVARHPAWEGKKRRATVLDDDDALIPALISDGLCA
ncbi:glycosyltransferase [uncultured Pseudacidovorax sp.]|uniref:glycosyltransferase n=1 Tax=uncultured Pseudacidovorax sp. TaxID=679313 RepID=UPI0025DE84D1|nr:glycosyltransferase [uncultured Pseudacidovorax sp.]